MPPFPNEAASSKINLFKVSYRGRQHRRCASEKGDLAEAHMLPTISPYKQRHELQGGCHSFLHRRQKFPRKCRAVIWGSAFLFIIAFFGFASFAPR